MTEKKIDPDEYRVRIGAAFIQLDVIESVLYALADQAEAGAMVSVMLIHDGNVGSKQALQDARESEKACTFQHMAIEVGSALSKLKHVDDLLHSG